MSKEPEQAGVLVDNLEHLGRAYQSAQRIDEAVAAARESVTVARSLNRFQPPGDREELGQALNYLTSLLDSADLLGEALEAVAEAVVVWRPVARQHPARLASLCWALARQSSLQHRMRVDGTGLAIADEAEALARELAAANPDVLRRLLVATIADVWETYYAAGLVDRALAVTEEAVSIARGLADRDPHSVDVLRWALDDYASVLDALDRPEEARTAREEKDRLGGQTVPGAEMAGKSTGDEPERPVQA